MSDEPTRFRVQLDITDEDGCKQASAREFVCCEDEDGNEFHYDAGLTAGYAFLGFHENVSHIEAAEFVSGFLSAFEVSDRDIELNEILREFAFQIREWVKNERDGIGKDLNELRERIGLDMEDDQ